MDLSLLTIVLVRSAIPENVGLVVRAMKAFGVENLTLVSPAFVWDADGPAYKTACGSRDLLDRIQVVDTLREAIGSCHRAIGFSRREHDFERPQKELVSWSDELRKDPKPRRVALVFGPEDFGLSTEDKWLCDTIVAIATQQPTLSLNLAQAATVVMYEITRGCGRECDEPIFSETLATQEDIHRVVDRLTGLLDRSSFFKEGRRERQIEALRNLVFRQRLTLQEYDMLMGILASL